MDASKYTVTSAYRINVLVRHIESELRHTGSKFINLEFGHGRQDLLSRSRTLPWLVVEKSE